MENKISDVLRKQDENERLNEMFANAAGSEDTTQREEHIKVFNLGGNRHQAVIYPEPVHFRDPKTGKWQDIDNTLEETVTAIGRRMLRNHAGRVRMEFPVRMDGGSMVSITDGDHTFAWRFEQEPQPIMRRPNVYDSNGEEVFASVVLTDTGEYIRMESAVYPVTIDPIVQTSTNPPPDRRYA